MSETVFSDLTTLGVGGPVVGAYVHARTEQEILAAVREAEARREPLLVLGGGSNLVVSDKGFEGTVVHVASRGLHIEEQGSRVLLTAAAGEPWDDVVAASIDQGLSGLEALSGIPGIAGATPVQNVGAYGTEISQVFHTARILDRAVDDVLVVTGEQLDFAYRDSLLKRELHGGSPRYVVLEVTFSLTRSTCSAPIRYAELARRLGVEVGQSAPSSQVRETVLGLRAGKGMVLDPQDRDTFSTGSFFTNPILPLERASDLPEGAPRFPVLTPEGREDPQRVKLSAAWLIQHAGFDRGFGLEGESRKIAGGRASLSTKHTLAITNRGGASAEDILAIARTVRDGVEQAFGVRLEAEPILVSESL